VTTWASIGLGTSRGHAWRSGAQARPTECIVERVVGLITGFGYEMIERTGVVVMAIFR
jgi:hypothetical protein